jgi:hypothetical protein
MATLLNNLQSQLESVYALESTYRVNDFLIQDAQLVSHLDNSHNSRELPEKLLIRQDGDNIDLALYLDADLVRRLEQSDPTRSLHDDNIHDFWLALEGVSHFLYVIYNVEYERGVSLFELELQAEVDKYIIAALLVRRQRQGNVPASLHYHLFSNARFDSRLNGEELYRYRNANELAGKFCAYLETFLNQKAPPSTLFNSLRRFYRLGHHHKVRAIASLGKRAACLP